MRLPKPFYFIVVLCCTRAASLLPLLITLASLAHVSASFNVVAAIALAAPICAQCTRAAVTLARVRAHLAVFAVASGVCSLLCALISANRTFYLLELYGAVALLLLLLQSIDALLPALAVQACSSATPHAADIVAATRHVRASRQCFSFRLRHWVVAPRAGGVGAGGGAAGGGGGAASGHWFLHRRGALPARR
eukprot:5451200-Pleurochrysis_carterae.AAC.1